MSVPSPAPPLGYHGRALYIDVSRASGEFRPIPSQVLRNFLGGSGLGTWLLLREGRASCDALAPEAPLVFALSPLVGSPLTTSAKFAVVSKSPLTQRINDSLASSHFAIAAKLTGCDAMVITGRAENPSILVIDNGEVHLVDASDVWGKDIPTAEQHLAKRFPGYRFAVIGPAGERLVKYATISHDGRHAGRGGSGAVLGSKNIKAIAVRGSQRCEWADRDEVLKLARDLSERSFSPATAKYRELGTATNLLVFNRLGTLPTRNFQAGSFAAATDLSPEALSVAREKARNSCAACTIGCEHIYKLDKSNEGKGVRLEYENLFALGSLCGIEDSETVLSASARCDELGIDTISTGGTIAFAMECVERGLLAEPWLRFGSNDALLQAIEQIGMRDGFGNRLAEGSRSLAIEIGQDSLDFAPQVKGLELPGYEPRALQTMAVGLAVGTRGADHNRSGAYEVDFSGAVDRRNVDEEAVPLMIETEDRAALLDSLILCKFLRGVFTEFFAETAQLLRPITGWNISGEELRKSAQRIVTARKEFNVQAGWTPKEDMLPSRFFEQTLPEDPQASLTREKLTRLIGVYNQQRGWSQQGYPPAGVSE